MEDCTAIRLSAANLYRVYERDLKQFALIQMNMGREVTRRLRETDNQLFARIGRYADVSMFSWLGEDAPQRPPPPGTWRRLDKVLRRGRDVLRYPKEAQNRALNRAKSQQEPGSARPALCRITSRAKLVSRLAWTR
jgi:hypothetical protein